MSLQKFTFILLVILSESVFSQQGNYKLNNFGNRSILLSGNVTGSVDDLGLAYYNPSRLTEVETLGFAFNAKAYQLVSIKLTDALNRDAKLSNTDFNSVATMAGGVFSLFGTKFAYSYLGKTKTNLDLSYSDDTITDEILELFPNADVYNVNTRISSKINDDWTGLTWAHKINEKFSLGYSIFMSIYRYDGISDINHTLQNTSNNVAYYQNITSFKQESYGLFIKLGANYKFPTFDLGVNINVPYLEIYEKGSFTYKKLISGLGEEYDKYIELNFKDLKADRKEPLGISIGAGIPIRNSKIHLNIDYVSPLGKYARLSIPSLNLGAIELTKIAFEEERQLVLNFGVGGEIYMSEKFKSYFSFSTDFNAYESNASVLDLSSEDNNDINTGEDLYHFGMGIDWSLSWGHVIFGTTYTNGSSEFDSPLKFDLDGIDEIFDTKPAKLSYTRWQFIVGLEIPIFDEKVNSLIKK